MAAKRHARRPSSGDAAKELVRNVGSNDDDEGEEESSKSGDTAMSAEPKALSPKQAGQTTPPSSDNAPRGGAAMMTDEEPAARRGTRRSKSGDAASPARNPLPDDDTADAGRNKRVATPKRGEKRSPPPRQEEERPEKRAAGPGGETVAAASAPRRNKRSKRSAEKDRRKKKKKKHLRRALSKPTSPPQLLESELNDSREDTPSLPQDDEHNVREMSEKEPEQSNTTEEKNTEQEHAGDTSAPHGKDMHSPHGEEEQEDVTNEEHADDAVNGKTSQARNAPSTKPCGSETEKKSWSYDDELKILNALVEHAQSHDGALPDSSHLLANLTFDKIDANEEKLTDKIRKLKARYRKWLSQGCPSDDPSHRLFKLSKIIWGLQTPYIHLDEDEQVEPTSKDFSELSKEYPHLAKEVKEYAETHSSGHIIMAMFKTIDDDKARDLDAKCKKQQIEAFKLELGRANLTNELLSTLSSRSHVKF